MVCVIHNEIKVYLVSVAYQNTARGNFVQLSPLCNGPCIVLLHLWPRECIKYRLHTAVCPIIRLAA
jgi:hypothetical protein